MSIEEYFKKNKPLSPFIPSDTKCRQLLRYFGNDFEVTEGFLIKSGYTFEQIEEYKAIIATEPPKKPRFGKKITKCLNAKEITERDEYELYVEGYIRALGLAIGDMHYEENGEWKYVPPNPKKIKEVFELREILGRLNMKKSYESAEDRTARYVGWLKEVEEQKKAMKERLKRLNSEN